MRTYIFPLMLTAWLAMNPAHGWKAGPALHGCTATGVFGEHGPETPDIAMPVDWVNAARGGIIKPAASPCSTLFSAATAEYGGQEDEQAMQLSQHQAFVLALAKAREQLVWMSSPTRGPGSTGVLVSARDNGTTENTVTVVLAVSDEIRELARRALGGSSRAKHADLDEMHLVNESEAASLIPLGVRLFWDEDAGLLTIVGFGSALAPFHADAHLAQEFRRAAEQQAQFRAKSELGRFLNGDLAHGGGPREQTGFQTTVSRGFVPAGVRTRLIRGPGRHWVHAASIYSAKWPNPADPRGGLSH